MTSEARYTIFYSPASYNGGQNWEVRDQKLTLVVDHYEREADAQRHADALNAVPASGFHWQNGLYFRRGPDGSVDFVRDGSNTESADLIASVPAPEWASIVCSVSAAGETGERWGAAQDFHGRET